jgi:hypothetical protein
MSSHQAERFGTASPSRPVLDFQRSFLRFTLDLQRTRPRTVSQPPPFTLNNSRFLLESACRISPPDPEAPPLDYVLGASCKAEQVNVTEDIWHDPPADMCLAASGDEFLIVKSWDRNRRGVMLDPPSLGEQPERHAGKVADAFTELRIDRVFAPGELLATTDAIVQAVLENRPLVCHTEYALADGRRALLEYPLKVINASEREVFYQVDTGPILVPDEEACDGRHAISQCRLAFIAHNSLGCTELLVNVPTPVGAEISVNHYSQVRKIQAENRLFALD